MANDKNKSYKTQGEGNNFSADGIGSTPENSNVMATLEANSKPEVSSEEAEKKTKALHKQEEEASAKENKDAEKKSKSEAKKKEDEPKCETCEGQGLIANDGVYNRLCDACKGTGKVV